MALVGKIRFGTDGWRAVIADDFTLANVRLCAAAIADWVKQTEGAAERGVVVGHDRRFLSEQFAEAVTEALLGQGVRVLYCDHGPVPTPVVTFTVTHTQAAAGVMITASHNPAIYNGIKVKTALGAPADRTTTTVIETYADTRQHSGEAIPLVKVGEPYIDGRYMPVDPLPDYQAAVQKLVDIEAIRRANLRIVVDAMYGAGAGVLQRLLGTGTRPIVAIRAERNPLFPGMKGPEPLAETLAPLMQAMQAHDGDIGIAFDGDGDRIALVDGKGDFVSSQETFAMLAMYLGERDDVTDGAIVRSVNGSVRLDILAERYNVPLIETPIGYAHIAPAMIEHRAMLGGEESGGFAFGTHLPERDAFVAALYLLDLMQRRGTDLAGLRYGVEIRTGAWHYERQDVPLAPDAVDAVHARLAAVESGTIDLAGTPVTKTVTLDGLKLIGEDRRWLLVRTSGTEPLARIYAEARDPETVASLLAIGRAMLDGAPLPAPTMSPVTDASEASVPAERGEATRQRIGRSRTYTRRR
ncbi:MAG: phosphoglucomutase/phosphomannomutase family protein [Thermomicrobia bacterium]|nr:phosphoglucomutase/phosphomannomutase family protein [Thermomicrobia bacterium]MCA1722809.1 phosphoglucomutase/phosphomannomutase family protein [Thermomicrobia bacterium]